MKSRTFVAAACLLLLAACAEAEPEYEMGIAVHVEPPSPEDEEPPSHELYVFGQTLQESEVVLTENYDFETEAEDLVHWPIQDEVTEISLPMGDYTVFVITRSGEAGNSCIHCGVAPTDAGICVFTVRDLEVTEIDGDARTWVSTLCDE